MATVTVSATYPVAPEVVWQELRHVERHVTWMSDAVAIEFLGDQREGVGTSFRCTTKVGPFKTEDLMTITLWVENTVMGVEHRGLVTGLHPRSHARRHSRDVERGADPSLVGAGSPGLLRRLPRAAETVGQESQEPGSTLCLSLLAA